MRIISIEAKLLAEIRYLNAGRGPGDFYNDIVSVHRGFVRGLPKGTSAIVVTSDLMRNANHQRRRQSCYLD